MIKENVLSALNDGYDVILEGILSTKSYGSDFAEIFKQHPSENYAFYFDISLDETIRRHKSRPSRNTASYTENDLRTFYNGEYVPILESEALINESLSANHAVEYIKKVSNI